MKREPKLPTAKGIVCPKCGCRHFNTTHTEPLAEGRICRRKQCRTCFRRIVTYEGPTEKPPLPESKE